MTYCFNPNCPNPDAPRSSMTTTCDCSWPLLLQDRFSAIRLIKEGNCCCLFYGEDRQLQKKCLIRQIAPKTPHKGYDGEFPEEAKRFHDLGGHDYIPPFITHFKHDNYWYLVEEYVGEDNLLSLSYSEEEVRSFLANTLKILHAIYHKYGNRGLHGDINPKNIVLHDKNKSLYSLVGFELSEKLRRKIKCKDENKTGTTGYVAQEQKNNKGKLSHTSDLYSLGVTCLQLLLGIRPAERLDDGGFLWTEKESLYRDIHDANLRKVLKKLTKKNKSERYKSAQEALQNLNKIEGNIWQRLSLAHKLIFGVIGLLATLITIDPALGKYVPSFTEFVKTWLFGNSMLLDDLVSNYPNLGEYVRASSPSSEQSSAAENKSDQHPVTNPVRSPDPVSLPTTDLHTVEDWTNARIYDEFNQAHSLAITSVAVNSDGTLIASSSHDGEVKFWDLKNKENNSGNSISSGEENYINSLAFRPNGSRLLVGGGKDGSLRIWDLDINPSLKASINLNRNRPQRRRDFNIIHSIAFSPDGNRLAVGSSTGKIFLWEISRLEEIDDQYLTLGEGEDNGHTDIVQSLVFNHDGTKLASASDDGSVKLWDSTTGDEIGSHKRHNLPTSPNDHNHVYSVAFSPDGKFLASGAADRTIQLWDLESKSFLPPLKNARQGVARSLVFIQVGENLILASGQSLPDIINLWDVDGRQLIGYLAGSESDRDSTIYSLAFEPNERFLVSGSGDGIVRIWEPGIQE